MGPVHQSSCSINCDGRMPREAQSARLSALTTWLNQRVFCLLSRTHNFPLRFWISEGFLLTNSTQWRCQSKDNYTWKIPLTWCSNLASTVVVNKKLIFRFHSTIIERCILSRWTNQKRWDNYSIYGTECWTKVMTGFFTVGENIFSRQNEWFDLEIVLWNDRTVCYSRSSAIASMSTFCLSSCFLPSLDHPVSKLVDADFWTR